MKKQADEPKFYRMSLPLPICRKLKNCATPPSPKREGFTQNRTLLYNTPLSLSKSPLAGDLGANLSRLAKRADILNPALS